MLSRRRDGHKTDNEVVAKRYKWNGYRRFSIATSIRFLSVTIWLRQIVFVGDDSYNPLTIHGINVSNDPHKNNPELWLPLIDPGVSSHLPIHLKRFPFFNYDQAPVFMGPSARHPSDKTQPCEHKRVCLRLWNNCYRLV